MDSQTGTSRAIIAKYPTVMHFNLIGGVCETLHFHYNNKLQSNELNKRMTDLEKEHGLRFRKLVRNGRSSSGDKHACKQIELKLKKNIQFRVQRGVDERTKPCFQSLKCTSSPDPAISVQYECKGRG